jgi:hypothetical protein
MIIEIDQQQQANSGIRRKTSSATETLSTASDAEAARRTQNISTWSSYLPQDCVESMVGMGWHETT